LNGKDVKDHLPMDVQEESAALADYAAAGIKLHAAGAIYFTRDEDADIRSKFEYCKRAGIGVIVAGDPAPETLPRIEKFVKEYDIRIAIHNHGPEDRLWPSPLNVLRAVKNMDPRLGCCIDVGHTVRAGTDVVQAIHEAGRHAVQRTHERPDETYPWFHARCSPEFCQVPMPLGKMVPNLP
jgi:sugar phosphate isomerase/epimerase